MAFFNFLGIYEAIFKSFDISSDTQLIEQLEKQGVKRAMIIKRSWIYGIFFSWLYIAIFFVMVLNAYLISLNFKSDQITAYVLIGLLVFNIGYWIISIFVYFIQFRRAYGQRGRIVETDLLKRELEDGDVAFRKFFNQTIFNYFVLILMTGFIIYEIIFVIGFSQTGMLGGLNIVLLCTQIVLSSKFKKKMLDMEMDFAVFAPGQVIFYDQKGLSRNVVNINAHKIKSITSEYSKIIGSIFNFGNIVIFTEGDEANMGEMRMQYVSCPSETVYEINQLLGSKEPDNKAAEESTH